MWQQQGGGDDLMRWVSWGTGLPGPVDTAPLSPWCRLGGPITPHACVHWQMGARAAA